MIFKSHAFYEGYLVGHPHRRRERHTVKYPFGDQYKVYRGEQDGPYIYYYNDGKIRCIGIYKEGELHGVRSKYNNKRINCDAFMFGWLIYRLWFLISRWSVERVKKVEGDWLLLIEDII